MSTEEIIEVLRAAENELRESGYEDAANFLAQRVAQEAAAEGQRVADGQRGIAGTVAGALAAARRRGNVSQWHSIGI